MAKKQPKSKPPPPKALRRRAEEMLRTGRQDISGMPIEDVHALVQELQVHQIELEIQNEELREAQVELAESRDRYSDLYEFAPVGYLTLNQDGEILTANLRAADMLAVDRRKLIGRSFSAFVDREGQDQWHLHRQAVFGNAMLPSGRSSVNSDATQACEVPLFTSQRSLWARLESTLFRSENEAVTQCRMALMDVSERKQIEAALRESEQHFRTMADGVALIIWVHDPQGEQEFVNQTFCEFFGITHEQAREGRWRALVHPDDVDSYADGFRACVRDQRPFHAEARVRRADGQWRWIESWGRPRHSQDGEFLGFVGTSADITEQKYAEEQLVRMNEMLEQQVLHRTEMLKLLQDVTRASNEALSVKEAMHQALMRISKFNGWQIGHFWRQADDGSGEMVSSGIWGLADDAQEAIGQLNEFRQICEQTRISAGQGIVGEVLQSGEPKWVDDITKYADWERGRVMSLGLHAAIAFPVTVNGQVVAVLEFFSNHPANRDPRFMEVMPDIGIQLGHVIARERTASLLRASEEQHRAVLAATPDAIVAVDSQGVITAVNRATEQIFGYDSTDLIGRNVSLLMPSPYREEHDGYIDRYLKTRQPRIIGVGRELVAQHKDGHVFPIQLSINAVDGRRLFVGVVQDISRRKALEKQVIDASADEQRRIGQDIHDGVGQELAGLRYMAQTHAEVLAEHDSPETRTAVRITTWLETIQGQLRLIIRELIPVEIDQQGLVAALRGLAQRVTAVHDLVCSFECQESLSLDDTTLATHIYRIAQEAVRNAVQHAQASHVYIQFFEDDGVLTLQVADDGVGISSSPEESSGFGLRSMAYRAGLIGARLDVSAGEMGGTHVTLTVLGEDTAANA